MQCFERYCDHNFISIAGHNPSKTDVQKIQDELRKDGKEEVEFGDFLGILAKYFKDMEDLDPAAELKQAFKWVTLKMEIF